MQKVIAEAGLAPSRRAAEVLIEDGLVRVNGRVAELGTKVDPTKDTIVVGGKTLRPRKSVRQLVVLVNKPRGVTCTHHDPHAETTIFELLPDFLQKERLLIAGRLDKDSEGMVILTNDGELAQKLTHPSRRVVKRYQVLLRDPFDAEKLPLVQRGITWEGERLKLDKVFVLDRGPEAGRRCEVHLEHGKKREIRRVMYAVGNDVKRLKRVQIGGLRMKAVPSAGFRTLSGKEVDMLLR